MSLTVGQTIATQELGGLYELNFIPEQIMVQQVRGVAVAFALYEESAYNTTPGSPAGIKLYPTSCTLKGSQSRTPSETLSAERARLEGFLDNMSLAGAIAGEINPTWFGYLLKHAIGGVTTTGSGPYTHTFAIGALPTGMLIETDHGSTISGSGRYLRHSGCRINTMSLEFPQSGACTFSADLMGADTQPASAALDATLTDLGHRGFGGFEAAIEEGGSTIAIIKKASLTITNDLDGDGYVIGSGGKRSVMPEAFASIEANITALFTDAALMNKALNATETSLTITLSRGDGLGTAGNESIEFSLPQGKYDKTNPEITGPGGIVVDLMFKGYRSGSTQPLSVVLKNAIASY